MRAMMMHFALGAALVSGLGKPVAYRYPTSAEGGVGGATELQVENTAFGDAVVYAVQGFRVQRLGMANGLSVTTLTIPRDMLYGGGSLRFAVHFIGGRGRSMSDEVTVSAGEKVNLFLPAH